MGSKGNQEQHIAQEAEVKLRDMNNGVNENKEKAMSRLLSLVIDIKPQLHGNLKL